MGLRNSRFKVYLLKSRIDVQALFFIGIKISIGGEVCLHLIWGVVKLYQGKNLNGVKSANFVEGGGGWLKVGLF